jgi:hypothetical protein
LFRIIDPADRSRCLVSIHSFVSAPFFSYFLSPCLVSYIYIHIICVFYFIIFLFLFSLPTRMDCLIEYAIQPKMRHEMQPSHPIRSLALPSVSSKVDLDRRSSLQLIMSLCLFVCCCCCFVFMLFNFLSDFRKKKIVWRRDASGAVNSRMAKNLTKNLLTTEVY